MNERKTDEFWLKFLRDTGRDGSARYYECFYFGYNEKIADELLALVLAGKKRATTSLLREYEITGERPPRAGDLSIVTDYSGEPRCVIETTAVTVLRFCDMTYEICSREGEDDELETWRLAHERCFKFTGSELGFEFTPDMPVVFEDFRLVYAPGRAAAEPS